MQDYEELLDAESGVIRVKMPGNAIVMLTTDYTDEKPSSVTGVCTEEGVVSWDASADPTHVYYRVYRGRDGGFVPSKANQIASTIDTKCRTGGAPGYYKVCSVNRSGNVSE